MYILHEYTETTCIKQLPVHGKLVSKKSLGKIYGIKNWKFGVAIVFQF